jgi:hypothetical protein
VQYAHTDRIMKWWDFAKQNYKYGIVLLVAVVVAIGSFVLVKKMPEIRAYFERRREQRAIDDINAGRGTAADRALQARHDQEVALRAQITEQVAIVERENDAVIAAKSSITAWVTRVNNDLRDLRQDIAEANAAIELLTDTTTMYQSVAAYYAQSIVAARLVAIINGFPDIDDFNAGHSASREHHATATTAGSATVQQLTTTLQDEPALPTQQDVDNVDADVAYTAGKLRDITGVAANIANEELEALTTTFNDARVIANSVTNRDAVAIQNATDIPTLAATRMAEASTYQQTTTAWVQTVASSISTTTASVQNALNELQNIRRNMMIDLRRLSDDVPQLNGSSPPDVETLFNVEWRKWTVPLAAPTVLPTTFTSLVRFRDGVAPILLLPSAVTTDDVSYFLYGNVLIMWRETDTDLILLEYKPTPTTVSGWGGWYTWTRAASTQSYDVYINNTGSIYGLNMSPLGTLHTSDSQSSITFVGGEVFVLDNLSPRNRLTFTRGDRANVVLTPVSLTRGTTYTTYLKSAEGTVHTGMLCKYDAYAGSFVTSSATNATTTRLTNVRMSDMQIFTMDGRVYSAVNRDAFPFTSSEAASITSIHSVLGHYTAPGRSFNWQSAPNTQGPFSTAAHALAACAADPECVAVVQCGRARALPLGNYSNVMMMVDSWYGISGATPFTRGSQVNGSDTVYLRPRMNYLENETSFVVSARDVGFTRVAPRLGLHGFPRLDYVLDGFRNSVGVYVNGRNGTIRTQQAGDGSQTHIRYDWNRQVLWLTANRLIGTISAAGDYVDLERSVAGENATLARLLGDGSAMRVALIGNNDTWRLTNVPANVYRGLSRPSRDAMNGEYRYGRGNLGFGRLTVHSNGVVSSNADFPLLWGRPWRRGDVAVISRDTGYATGYRITFNFWTPEVSSQLEMLNYGSTNAEGIQFLRFSVHGELIDIWRV